MKKKHPVPDLQWELKVGHPRILVAGVDEVGRGCLAGPVVAAAVIPPSELRDEDRDWLDQVSDSKLLNAKTRESLAPRIRCWARACAVGVASVEEIDRINILQASHLAMSRALRALAARPDHVLFDGKFVPKGLPWGMTPIIKGDQKSLSIACASILAKVWRDQLMVDLDSEYPGYGLAGHKGYGTPAHLDAIDRLGASRQAPQPRQPVLIGEGDPALKEEQL